MKEKITLTWNDFENIVPEIANYYKKQNITHIVGISRGGLPLAVCLSNLLNIPMTPIVWQTRDGSIRQVKELEVFKNQDTILFVDDICDSGKTIKEIKQHLPQSRWCTIVNKQWNLTEYSPIDMCGDDRWVIFPWEG